MPAAAATAFATAGPTRGSNALGTIRSTARSSATTEKMASAAATFMASVTAALLYYVLDWHPISTDKVFGAVAAYVLIAFSFASLFGVLQQVEPHAFHASEVHAPNEHLDWATLMYFSFTVLTSTGFGEITPVTKMARSLIIIEQVLGVMYVAFLIARLANLYGTRGHRRD